MKLMYSFLALGVMVIGFVMVVLLTVDFSSSHTVDYEANVNAPSGETVPPGQNGTQSL